MNYKEMIQSSKGDEETMWQSVDHIDEFLEEMKKVAPDKVRCFMEKQYEAMNGKHVNEWLAKKLVSMMFHTDTKGNTVSGELVTPDEAMTLIADKPAEKQARCKWDAYVATNNAVHDGINSGVPKSDILKIAKYTWFHDDDMKDPHKVFWYFKDRIFE